MNDELLNKIWDDIDSQFADNTTYEVRQQILQLVEQRCISFGLFLTERYTHHPNFGFRDEYGDTSDIISIYQKYCQTL